MSWYALYALYIYLCYIYSVYSKIYQYLVYYNACNKGIPWYTFRCLVVYVESCKFSITGDQNSK